MKKFLDGVRVVDLTRLLPGPFATLLLADMGAEVIKIEDPMGGDYARYHPPMVGASSAFFQSLNRNKYGVTLNLKSERGKEILRQLLGGADVLIESFRPGVLARLGFDSDTLRRDFPELVICSISGYGQSGPKRNVAGHDANYLALAGVLDGNGRRSQAPHLPGFQLADIAGGSLYGALGITAALYHREQSGEGAYLDISMTEGALSFLIPTIARHAAGDKEERGAGMLTGGLPSYRVYPTADGRFLAVGALEPKFWDPFVSAIGAEELKGRGLTRGEEGQKIARKLEAILKSEPLQYWEQKLEGLDVCVEPIRNIDEVLKSELHRARQVFFEIQGLTHVRTPLTPRDREHRRPPEHGADNHEIYSALGFDSDELETLRDDGVI